MEENNSIIILYVPCPDYQAAEQLSKKLLDERLIFCSNLFQNMSSLYLWQGEIQQSQEVIMIAKTLKKLQAEAEMLIEKEHPYEQAVVLSFLSQGSSSSLFRWAEQELKK